MVFEVTRTSLKDGKPFKNCFPLELTDVEAYSSSPEEYNKKVTPITGKKWDEEGTNHRIINNVIKRDVGKKQTWGIRIDTLKELMEFKNEVNEELIFRTSYIDFVTPCIEIHDDYRG
jgi:hypothetical protein